MDNDIYVDAVETDGHRLLAVAAGSLDRPVAACPDWDVAELVVHMGRVYTYIGDLLAHVGSSDQPEVGSASPPADQAVLVTWVAELHADLVDKLRTTDPEAAAWNWAGTGQAGFFARRMAH
ncbi:MAG: maleylpyruvate isomerase N-terminal domain-containing protein, partial [Acidimicrobiales bacterium]